MEDNIFGYARVSSRDQNEERQVIALLEMGVPEQNIYVDKQSGKDFNRPQYKKLLRRVNPDDANKIMSGYERSIRLPAKDKLKRMAGILDVNIRMISEYDLNDPHDLYYLMLWLEEMCSNFTLTRQEIVKPENESQRFLSEKYFRWHEMKRKYSNHEITYEEYWDWKLSREV